MSEQTDSAAVPEQAEREFDLPGRRPPLRLEVEENLRRRILSGELPPGTPLREVQVGSELGVSRTPLREAFRTLANEGLVDILPNKSVVVPQLRAPDIEHLVRVFANIESLGGELACKNVSDSEISAMGALYGEMVECFERRERARYLEINATIHRMTMEIAANPVLLKLWQSLVPRMQRVRALPNLDQEHWSNALFQHSRMFAALAARDDVQLARLTREHFLDILPYLPRQVEPAEDAPPAS